MGVYAYCRLMNSACVKCGRNVVMGISCRYTDVLYTSKSPKKVCDMSERSLDKTQCIMQGLCRQLPKWKQKIRKRASTAHSEEVSVWIKG